MKLSKKERATMRLVWLLVLLAGVTELAGAAVFERVISPDNCEASDRAVCLTTLFYLNDAGE